MRRTFLAHYTPKEDLKYPERMPVGSEELIKDGDVLRVAFDIHTDDEVLYGVTSEMEELRGSLVTVEEVINHMGDLEIILDSEDNRYLDFSWSCQMFENYIKIANEEFEIIYEPLEGAYKLSPITYEEYEF